MFPRNSSLSGLLNFFNANMFSYLLLLTFCLVVSLNDFPAKTNNGNGGSALVYASQSGIYIDNGIDQTIMHRVLDDNDKLDVSYEILEFLGLSERPRHKHGGHLSLR